MEMIAMFFLFFVAGPLAFRRLLTRRATRRQQRALLILMGGSCLVALGLRYGLPTPLLAEPRVLGLVLVLLWLTWIAAIALAAQSLRHIDPSRGMMRWSRAIGTIATTAPWFGFATAANMSA
ncbi:MAG: hypothetical protein AAF744_08360 [Pseudomonadota bacterium]